MTNPIPTQYMTDTPGIGGRFKVKPDDFIVDEHPTYAPCGEGEHLFLFIEKRGLDHRTLVQILRTHFDVPERAVGYAGMKDKQAVARQQVSVHLPGRRDRDVSLNINDERLNILSADWHRNKLRRGHLESNRFSIRIRDVNALDTPRALNTMRLIEEHGVPAWFDAQRFGRGRNNHIVGTALIKGEWEHAARALLGETSTPSDDAEAERRRLFEEQKWEEAAAHWGSRTGPEVRVLKALARGASMEQAVRSMGRNPMNFLMNASQSASFNEVVNRRLSDRSLGTLRLGDLAWLHGRGSVFAVTDDEFAKPELATRVQDWELSPSGPLWGPSMTRAGGSVDALEVDALNQLGLTPDDLDRHRHVPSGGRRPLRVPVRNIELSGGVDSEGGYVSVAFDLPPGAYATIVLRELMKNDADAVTSD